jgi:hypothetical protein
MIEASPGVRLDAVSGVGRIPPPPAISTVLLPQLRLDSIPSLGVQRSAQSQPRPYVRASVLADMCRIDLPLLWTASRASRIARAGVPDVVIRSRSTLDYDKLLAASIRTLEAEARSLAPRAIAQLIRQAKLSRTQSTSGGYLLQQTLRLAQRVESLNGGGEATGDRAREAITEVLRCARLTQRRERRLLHKTAVRAFFATIIAELASVITRHGPPSLSLDPCPLPG